MHKFISSHTDVQVEFKQLQAAGKAYGEAEYVFRQCLHDFWVAVREHHPETRGVQCCVSHLDGEITVTSIPERIG